MFITLEENANELYKEEIVSYRYRILTSSY